MPETIYQYGLQVPRIDRRMMNRMFVSHDHISRLGTPPAKQEWGGMAEVVLGLKNRCESRPWGMMGNGSSTHNPPEIPGGVGDCAETDVSHSLMLWTALGHGPLIIPTTMETLNLYTVAAGFDLNHPVKTDHGTDPIALSDYLVHTGFLGHKIDQYLILDPSKTEHVKWAVTICGSVTFAILVPSFAPSQFELKVPWDYHGQPFHIRGGHDIPCVGYETNPDGSTTWHVITWGRRQAMTDRFWNKFQLLAIARLSKDFIRTSGSAPNKLNLDQMINDLGLIAGAE